MERFDLPAAFEAFAYARKAGFLKVKAAKEQGRRGVVLTCKEKLVHYYAKFGFVDEGISGSTHGNVVWHQMRLPLAY